MLKNNPLKGLNITDKFNQLFKFNPRFNVNYLNDISWLDRILPRKKSNFSQKKVSALSEYLTTISREETHIALNVAKSSLDGLTQSDVNTRLSQYGHNTFNTQEKKSLRRQFSEILLSPINLILITLSLLSMANSEESLASGVILVIIFQTIFSFLQQRKIHQNIEQFQNLVGTKVNVQRQSKGKNLKDSKKALNSAKSSVQEINADQLVPGDIIFLSTGDMIPADVRIIYSEDFFVDQSVLTGEKLPVEKFSSPCRIDVDKIFDLSNIAYMGTTVISGKATALVLCTGRSSYLGTQPQSVKSKDGLTSFEQGMNHFIELMTKIAIVLVPVLFLINGMTKGIWLDSLIFSLALGLSIAPHILPNIVKINLGRGAKLISEQGVFTKRLDAIQYFSAIDTLCLDNTGLLTQDEVYLLQPYSLNGKQTQSVSEWAYLNTAFHSGISNLLDQTLTKYQDQFSSINLNSYKKIDEIPYDSERRRTSVVLSKDDQHTLITKGDLHHLLKVCTSFIQADGTVSELTETDRKNLLETIQKFGEDGFRIEAIAYRHFETSKSLFSSSDEEQLVFVGYIALIDPPRESASKGLNALQTHGINIKILTADNIYITKKICHSVGFNLELDQILTGSDIEIMSEAQLNEAVENYKAFAQLSPVQKARVINALRSQGHIVGFIGDSIDDSMAMKVANVSIATNQSIGMIKDQAEIILLEKNLLHLEQGLVQSRRVFGNIIKYIKTTTSLNFGKIFSLVGASAILPYLPMLPAHILLINLAYDASQSALATDDVDEEYLSQPRQWESTTINKFMMGLGPVVAIFEYMTFFVLLLGFQGWYEGKLFQSGYFVMTLLAQVLILHVIRTGKVPFVNSYSNPILMYATLAISSIALILPFSGLAPLLGLVQLPISFLVIGLILVIGYLVVAQIVKQWVIKKYGIN